MSETNQTADEAAATDGLQAAEDILAEVESGPRSPSYWLAGALIIALCAAWSIFQLWHAEDPFGAKVARYIHLSFAMSLAFLAYPAFKSGVEIAAPRDWRRYFIKKAILLAIFLGVSAILFTDILQGFLVFAVLVVGFSVFGLLVPLRARRHLLNGLLLGAMSILLWSNLDGILKGLETADWWNTVADILFWGLTIAITVEAVRRILAGLLRIFVPASEAGVDCLSSPLVLAWRRRFAVSYRFKIFCSRSLPPAARCT